MDGSFTPLFLYRVSKNECFWPIWVAACGPLQGSTLLARTTCVPVKVVCAQPQHSFLRFSKEVGDVQRDLPLTPKRKKKKHRRTKQRKEKQIIEHF